MSACYADAKANTPEEKEATVTEHPSSVVVGAGKYTLGPPFKKRKVRDLIGLPHGPRFMDNVKLAQASGYFPTSTVALSKTAWMRS